MADVEQDWSGAVRWHRRRPRRGNRVLFAAGVLMFLALAGIAAQGAEARKDWPAVHEYAPARELVEAAARQDVELDGIALAHAVRGPLADDTVVLFVVLDQRPRQTQWLVQLRGPLKVAPAREDGRGPATVLYGMDGRAIRFPDRRETYSILALGPFRDAEAAVPVPVRAIETAMNAGFLDERFDRAAGFMLRAGRARHEGRLREDELFFVSPNPLERPDPAARERFVVEAGLTDEVERSLAATVPSLNEFARVIARTPGLREVLFAVVERPSIWSIIAHFGRFETDFRFRSGEVVPSTEPPLGFAGIGRCYIVPFTFSIHGEPALECSMLVAEPRAPLRLCGGIVAIVAEVPGRSDLRLIVRVLAARPGGAAGGP